MFNPIAIVVLISFFIRFSFLKFVIVINKYTYNLKSSHL